MKTSELVSILQSTASGSPEYESAFTEIYGKYKGRVVGMCYRMTGSYAEDMVQDVFMKVHAKIKGFEGRSHFNTWLHRITVNTCLMHIRKNKHSISTISGEDIDLDSFPAKESFDTELEKPGASDMTRGMHESWRKLLEYKAENMTYKEIVKITGLSIPALKTQLFRARKKARARYNRTQMHGRV